MKLSSGQFANSAILDKLDHHLWYHIPVLRFFRSPFHTDDTRPWLILFCLAHILRRQQDLRIFLRAVDNRPVDAELPGQAPALRPSWRKAPANCGTPPPPYCRLRSPAVSRSPRFPLITWLPPYRYSSMVRLTLHSTIAPPCSTAPHSSPMSVILNGYGDTRRAAHDEPVRRVGLRHALKMPQNTSRVYPVLRPQQKIELVFPQLRGNPLAPRPCACPVVGRPIAAPLAFQPARCQDAPVAHRERHAHVASQCHFSPLLTYPAFPPRRSCACGSQGSRR